MDQFVNRLDELERLQTLYESDAAELAIIKCKETTRAFRRGMNPTTPLQPTVR
mgnify:CR=1 FL=1|jgi:hypothetical protein